MLTPELTAVQAGVESTQGRWDSCPSLETQMSYHRYLNPKVCKHKQPKPLKTAQEAIILHTLGVQVGLLVEGIRFIFKMDRSSL